jgi:hypothetical protein
MKTPNVKLWDVGYLLLILHNTDIPNIFLYFFEDQLLLSVKKNLYIPIVNDN